MVNSLKPKSWGGYLVANYILINSTFGYKFKVNYIYLG